MPSPHVALHYGTKVAQLNGAPALFFPEEEEPSGTKEGTAIGSPGLEVISRSMVINRGARERRGRARSPL